MNKLEVGMYVRTTLGISKYLGIGYDNIELLEFDKLDERIWSCDFADILFKCDIDKEIKKYSYNIIDLIEVGDYVNGYKIRDIRKDIIYCCEDEFEDYCIIIDKNDITSIVTKEQFESMEYKLGDNNE